jgi:hypothetical protein
VNDLANRAKNCYFFLAVKVTFRAVFTVLYVLISIFVDRVAGLSLSQNINMRNAAPIVGLSGLKVSHPIAKF